MKLLMCRWFWIQFAGLLFSGVVCAQSDLRKANEHFQSYEFARAITEYQQVLQNRSATLALAQNLAHAYRLNNNSAEAETWFAKVLTFPGYTPINRYHYAEALKSNGKYAQARSEYQAYAASVPQEAAMIAKKVEALDLVQTWLGQPAAAVLQPAANLNSAYADFSPAFFDQGLLFASDRPADTSPATVLAGWTGRPFLQLFYAGKQNGQWRTPAPLEPVVNTATHNGPAATAAGSNLIYFTRTFIRKETQKGVNTDPTSWTAAVGPANGLVNRLAIYSAEKRNSKWGNLRAFAYNKVAQYSVGHPALSPDGKYLYFVSDMPGGKGLTDIYYCERRTGGSWSRPVNAGPGINTSGRESFPVIAADGTLYFASDGHPGMGGLDLFSAKGLKAAWSEVQNLKPPFNSAKDDFGILWELDGRSGYLSSNREATDGTDNIYAFTPPAQTLASTPPDTLAKPGPLPVASATPAPSPALLPVARPEPLPAAETAPAQSPRPAALPKSNNTTIAPSVPAPATHAGTGSKGKPGHPDLLVHRAEAITPIILNNIYYDLDKADIRPDAAGELHKLVVLLQQNPRIKIRISAHTDSRQSQAYNLELSQRRAQAVVNYLIERGIAAGRLTAKGFGKSRLRNHCGDNSACPEAAHQVNRRTEFSILQ